MAHGITDALLIYNPTSGRRRNRRFAEIEQSRGMVIACGGDGTVNEIINGLAGSYVPLALLPAGTANILAKELGIPWDIPHAARLIADGVVRRIAIGIAMPGNGNHSA